MRKTLMPVTLAVAVLAVAGAVFYRHKRAR